MTRVRSGLRQVACQSEQNWARRVEDAEQDYMACLAEFGHSSGEAYAALWHWQQLKRLAGLAA